MTERVRSFRVMSGIGQNSFETCLPPEMAEFAFRFRVTSGIGQKSFETCFPPRNT